VGHRLLGFRAQAIERPEELLPQWEAGAVAATPRIRNRLLNFLSASDLQLLQLNLVSDELPQRHYFERPNKPFDQVFFPETGVVSVVASQGDLRVEIGVIGCEGMTGTALVLGNDSSPHETFVQIPVQGLRLSAQQLRDAMDQSPTMRSAFLKYVQAFMVQTAHTAVANSVAKLHERLARWLLMAHDRVEGNELQLTHEFLSIMLAVRRAGVTEAVHVLEDNGLITCKRGIVIVLNRKGLEKIAGKFYGFPEKEYRRLVLG
jgi:CRP-like cAMP-binding protein